VNQVYMYQETIKYIQNGQKIKKKKQISPQLYLDMLEFKDPSKDSLVKRRDNFIWEGVYFRLETILNKDGEPTILRVDTDRESTHIDLPPFVKVVQEVTEN
jgi:hypothetical protein